MMMELLRALYDPLHPLPERDEDYRLALEDMELFKILPQVNQMLKDAGLTERVPAFFRDRLKAKFQQGMHHNLYMKHQEELLLKRFDERGLQVIPLKGTRFAERYFGHLAARLSGDIDLFVPVDALKESIRCAEEAGYRFEVVKDHHARLHLDDRLTVELHWTLDKREWSDLRTEPFWKDAKPDAAYSHVKELSLLHTFYFMCLHGARHQMDSIRYVLDVAHLIQHFGHELDYPALLEQAARDKTYKRIQAVLSIVYNVFPHLNEKKPLPFNRIDTKWDYATIREAKLGVKKKRYYAYKLFFRHFLFDTLKHQMRSIRKAY